MNCLFTHHNLNCDCPRGGDFPSSVFVWKNKIKMFTTSDATINAKLRYKKVYLSTWDAREFGPQEDVFSFAARVRTLYLGPRSSQLFSLGWFGLCKPASLSIAEGWARVLGGNCATPSKHPSKALSGPKRNLFNA